MIKTKEEILVMKENELIDYKSSEDLNPIKNINCTNVECLISCVDCNDCFYCSNCIGCDNCGYCTNCAYCKGLNENDKDGKIGIKYEYMICNVQVTREEYEGKMNEIKNEVKEIVK